MPHLDSFPIDPPPPDIPATVDAALPADAHVVVPDEVDIPLPRATAEQIAVPASMGSTPWYE